MRTSDVVKALTKRITTTKQKAAHDEAATSPGDRIAVCAGAAQTTMHTRTCETKARGCANESRNQVKYSNMDAITHAMRSLEHWNIVTCHDERAVSLSTSEVSELHMSSFYWPILVQFKSNQIYFA